MTNHDKARPILSDAEHTMREAESLFREANWNFAIRRSQEAVELALKAVFHFLGIDYPKKHDVGIEFAKIAREKIPAAREDELQRILAGSAWLDARRTLSFYRDQEYTRADAETALEYARFTMSKIRDWLKGVA